MGLIDSKKCPTLSKWDIRKHKDKQIGTKMTRSERRGLDIMPLTEFYINNTLDTSQASDRFCDIV